MIDAIFYKKPNGSKEFISITEINQDDSDYINENAICVSLEEMNGEAVLYFDNGVFFEDGETPNEIVVFSDGRSCKETIAEGVNLLKARKKTI